MRILRKEDFGIEKTKKYYSQKDIIDEIHSITRYPSIEIRRILNIAGNLVKEKLGERNDFTEIKLFSGLKLTSRTVKLGQSKSNPLNSTDKKILIVCASFTDDFKKKIHKINNSNYY